MRKKEEAPRESRMAAGLAGSEILRIAGEVRTLISRGKPVYNLTVGDFSSREFPIPETLLNGIVAALRAGETNYPPSNGMPVLREAIPAFYREWLGLDYPPGSVLVSSGARPGIYAVYRVACDPCDRVVFPVPSWNNNHYCEIVGAEQAPVVTTAETAFQPTRALLEESIRGARLLALNSPLNPAGTAFDADQLGSICDLVLEENERRAGRERPLYLLYDQVYWMLTFGRARHLHPVGLRPEIRPYTLYVDAISKAFASTGLRVGWVLGPEDLVSRMSDLLGHVGAWAPRSEQVATARLLRSHADIDAYHAVMKVGVQRRLDLLYRGIAAMKRRHLPVHALSPMGAIYLSIHFELNGRKTPDGRVLHTNDDVRDYLLKAAGFAIVPFQAFGVPGDTGWFRASVGAVSEADIEQALPRLEEALEALS